MKKCATMAHDHETVSVTTCFVLHWYLPECAVLCKSMQRFYSQKIKIDIFLVLLSYVRKLGLFIDKTNPVFPIILISYDTTDRKTCLINFMSLYLSTCNTTHFKHCNHIGQKSCQTLNHIVHTVLINLYLFISNKWKQYIRVLKMYLSLING
jgi:hypothetical protein